MLGRDRIKKIYDLPLRVRGKLLEDKASQFYFDSKHVSTLFHLYSRFNWIYKRAWFDETIYLPFETISIPAPKEFDKVLKAYYNDWHKIVFKGMYSRNFSVNISPQEYFEEKFLPDNLTARSNSLRSRLNMDEIRGGIIVSSWKKKIWKAQLNLILELKRVCERLDLKFWASSSTLFAVWKFHGFNPEDDFVTLEMTREDIDKLKIESPYRIIQSRDGIFEIHDERTSMIKTIDKMGDQIQGIFIEIVPTDQSPNEIEYLPFEFTSIPVPKNYEEILKNFTNNFENTRIQRFFDGVVTADISYEESRANLKREILYHQAVLIDLESSEN